MAREFATGFYKSQAWKNCREEYAKKMRYLCEECLEHGRYKTGEIVHHKIPLTPENISDPTITLSFDNLRLLCRDCHAAEHDQKKKARRYLVDEYGRVTVKNDSVL